MAPKRGGPAPRKEPPRPGRPPAPWPGLSTRGPSARARETSAPSPQPGSQPLRPRLRSPLRTRGVSPSLASSPRRRRALGEGSSTESARHGRRGTRAPGPRAEVVQPGSLYRARTDVTALLRLPPPPGDPEVVLATLHSLSHNTSRSFSPAWAGHSEYGLCALASGSGSILARGRVDRAAGSLLSWAGARGAGDGSLPCASGLSKPGRDGLRGAGAPGRARGGAVRVAGCALPRPGGGGGEGARPVRAALCSAPVARV